MIFTIRDIGGRIFPLAADIYMGSMIITILRDSDRASLVERVKAQYPDAIEMTTPPDTWGWLLITDIPNKRPA